MADLRKSATVLDPLLLLGQYLPISKAAAVSASSPK